MTTANTASPGAGVATVASITITAGASAANYNFGGLGSGLSGSVYVDRNGNGQRDAGEPGIPGVSVSISGVAATGDDICTLIVCTLVTDAAGGYWFQNLPGSDAAGYRISEQSQASTPLSNWMDGAERLGTVNGAAAGTVFPDAFHAVVVGASQLGEGYDFGERGSSLAGRIYLDLDSSGAFSAGDTPLVGQTVTLSGTLASGGNICAFLSSLSPARSCVLTTDANGEYVITDLPAGTYTLTETQPAGYLDGPETVGSAGGSAASSSISAISLGAGVLGVDYNFGEIAAVLTMATRALPA